MTQFQSFIQTKWQFVVFFVFFFGLISNSPIEFHELSPQPLYLAYLTPQPLSQGEGAGDLPDSRDEVNNPTERAIGWVVINFREFRKFELGLYIEKPLQ